MLSSHDDIV